MPLHGIINHTKTVFHIITKKNYLPQNVLKLRFFCSSKALKMRNGEKIIDRLEFIEDTKGNSGDKGVLVITNLRAIWHSMTLARISLCEKKYTIPTIVV